MRLWPLSSIASFATVCLVVLSACGGTRSERIECSEASQCESGEVCLRDKCTAIESASVEASGEAVGAPASISVIDAFGKVCEASSCKDLPYGSRVTFRAEAAPGVRFSGWSGSPECTGSSVELVIEMLTRDTHCVANYVARRRVSGQVVGVEGGGVTATSASPEAVCSGNSCEVDANGSVRLEAMDRWGERFVGWSGAGCDTRATSRIIEVTPGAADVSCTATFQPRVSIGGKAMGVEAVIEVSSSAPFQACEPGSCLIDRGESALLNAPLVPGFRFAGWSGTDACSGDDPRLAIQNATKSQLCLATYLRRFSVTGAATGATPPPDLRAISSDLYAACDANTCEVDNHGTVTLIAWSAPGYRLEAWSGAGCGMETGAALEIPDVTSDLRCVASYVPGIAVMGAVIGAPGDVKATSDTAGARCAGSGCVIPMNGNVTLEAPTIEGYRFQRWKGEPGCEGSELTLRFTGVTQSKTCEAEYFTRYVVRGLTAPPEAGSVRASSANPGAACNNNACTLDAGGAVQLEATAAAGYRFSGWSGGGACTGSAPSITIADVTRNVSCQANFLVRASVSGIASPETGGRVEAFSDSGAAQCIGSSCTVDEGSRVDLMATPLPGFRFAGWSECSNATSAALRINDVQRPVVCRANFVPLRFTVASRVSPAGAGSVDAFSGAQAAQCSGESCTVDYGSDVRLTANPASGYRFVNWSGCATGNGRTLTVANVRVDQTCQANFTRISLTVTASAAPAAGGSVAASSTSPGTTCNNSARCTVAYGASVTLTATPARGYRFTDWSGCGPGPEPTLQLNNITTALECRANFELSRWAVSGVASPADGGSVAASSNGDGSCRGGRCSVDFGASVTLEARPNAGFGFRGWSGCQTSSNARITIANVAADVTCQANFERQRYAVTGGVAPAASGAVVASSSAAGAQCAGATCTVNHGSAVVLTAVESAEFRFVNWTSCPVTGGPAITIPSVTGAVSCTANFARRTLVVTGVAGIGGSVAGVGPQCTGNVCTVPLGGSATFVAAPAPGFRFAGWAGCSPADALTASVNDVTAPTMCTASFQQQFTISSEVEGNGTVTTSCGMPGCTVDAGATVRLTAVARSGFLFERWSGCSAATTEVIDVVALRNATCTASFRADSVAVTAVAGAGGTVAPRPPASCSGSPCTVSVLRGGDVTFTATPTPGNEFVRWSGERCVQDGTNVTVRNVQAATTCTAEFGPATRTVSATAGPGGSVTVSCGTSDSCSVPNGTRVTFTATPDRNATFRSWSCTNNTTNDRPEFTLAVTQNLSCTATFTAVASFTVTGTAGEGGTLTTPCRGATCSASVVEGGTALFTAQANPTFRFVQWRGDPGCASSTPMLSVENVREDKRCEAVFELVPPATFTVMGTADGAGTIGPCGARSCPQSVVAGDDVTLTAVPDSGSRFVSWTGRGQGNACRSQSEVLTIANVRADITCTATFEAVVTPEPTPTPGPTPAPTTNVDQP